MSDMDNEKQPLFSNQYLNKRFNRMAHFFVNIDILMLICQSKLTLDMFHLVLHYEPINFWLALHITMV
jgi:hypothetical protein